MVKEFEDGIPRLENISLRRLLTSIKEDKQKIISDLKNLLEG